MKELEKEIKIRLKEMEADQSSEDQIEISKKSNCSIKKK